MPQSTIISRECTNAITFATGSRFQPTTAHRNLELNQTMKTSTPTTRSVRIEPVAATVTALTGTEVNMCHIHISLDLHPLLLFSSTTAPLVPLVNGMAATSTTHRFVIKLQLSSTSTTSRLPKVNICFPSYIAYLYTFF